MKVKIKFKVKVKGMVKRMVLGTQIKFPANLVRIRQDLSKLESYHIKLFYKRSRSA